MRKSSSCPPPGRRLGLKKARQLSSNKPFSTLTESNRLRHNLLLDLKVQNMVRSAMGTIDNSGKNVRQKVGLNRSVSSQGWALFYQHLTDKATNSISQVYWWSSTLPTRANVARSARTQHKRTARFKRSSYARPVDTLPTLTKRSQKIYLLLDWRSQDVKKHHS